MIEDVSHKKSQQHDLSSVYLITSVIAKWTSETKRFGFSEGQVLTTVVGQVAAERVFAHKKTVCSACDHCLFVLKQRVKGSQRDG
jgi:hypothetical protein